MKNGRKIAVCIFSLLLLCVSLVGIFACGKECEHQWQEATCTAPKTCIFCSATEGEKASHTGGTATCKTKAKCSVCGEEHGDLGDHTWVDATCTQPKHCAECGVTEGDVISHTVGTAATCMKKAVCSVCNQEFGELGAHVYNAEVVKDEAKKSEATCTDPATYYRSCVCGAVSRDSKDSFSSGATAPHVYNEDAVKPEAVKDPASCSSAAVYYKSCSCGAVSTNAAETFTSGIPNPHRFTVASVKTEAKKSDATCKSAAVYYKSCACGLVSQSEADTFTSGDPLPHDFVLDVADNTTKKSNATCTDPAVYYKSCACGEVSKKDADTFTKGTAAGHSHKLDSTTPATCTAPAVNHYVCDCGDEYSNNVGSELGHDIVGVTPEKRHVSGCKYVYVYTCKAQGCGEEVEGATVEEHVYKATLTKEANCKTPGEKTLTCTCGHTKTEAVPVDTVNGHEWEKGATVGNVRTDECKHCGETKEVTVLSAPTNADSLKGSEVQVSGGDGENKVDIGLKFDDGVVDKIKETTSENVTVSAGAIDSNTLENLLSPEQLEQIGGDTVYDFSISYGENDKVSTFGEENYVTITLPYTLAPNEDVDSIAVWFINDNGELESIAATYNNGYVTFKTNHFSYYTVTRLNPAERCAIYGCSIVEKTVEGSCTEDAYTLKVCVRCHKTEKVVTEEADGHDFETVTQDATCTENGHITHTCKDCGYNYKTKIAATGHTFSVVDSSDATCVENGFVKYGCDDCDAEYSITSGKANHNYKRTVVAPTCEAYGYTSYECEYCHDTYTDKFTTETGHDYEASGWTWSADFSSASFVLVCKHDASHVLEFTDVKSSKTVTHGKCSNFTRTVYTVSLYYADVMYSDEKKVEVGTPDHVFSETLKFDGTSHWRECVCGEKTDVTAHEFKNETVTKEPTCAENGEKIAYCDCGATLSTPVLATRKHNYEGGACTVCGEKKSNSFYVNFANSLKETNGFVLQIENLNYEFEETNSGILGEIKTIGKIKQLSVAQLALYVEDGKLKGAATGSVEIFNGPIKDDYATYGFKAVIKDEMVYVLAEQTIGEKTETTELKYSFDWILMQAFEMEPQEARAIVDFIIDTALPTLDRIINNDPEKLDDITKDLLNIMFTFERQDDGTYLAALDYDKLEMLNENLATLPVSKVVDYYFGNGTFDEYVDLVFEVLDLKISEIPDYLVSIGVDFDYVIAEVNALAVMMGEPADFDAADLFYNEEFADLILGDAMFASHNYEIGDYVEMVEGFVTMLRENSLYFIITGDIEDTEYIEEMVASIIDMVEDYVYFTLATDSTGTLTEVCLGADAEKIEVEDVTFSMTFDIKLKLGARIDVTWSDIIEKIEADVIGPSADDKYDEPYEDGYEYMSYVTYKDKDYRAYIYKNRLAKVNYNKLLALIIEESCAGWKRYEVEYAVESYGFDLKWLYDMEEGRLAYVLIVDYATGETIECVPVSESEFLATYQDGTQKTLDFATLPEDYAEAYAIFFGEPVWVEGDDTEYVRYYYNAAEGIYSHEDPHKYVYDYDFNGLTCREGYHVTVTCENCDYHEEYERDYCRKEYTHIDLSEYGFCGGYLEFYECEICGNCENILFAAYNCRFTSTTEDIVDEKGNVIGESETRVCSECGFKCVENYWTEYTDICEFIVHYECEIYGANGELIDTFTKIVYDNSHNYEYVMEEGKTCNEEHTVTRFCTICNDTETFEHWGHYEIYESGSTTELGMCNGEYGKEYCAICGHTSYGYINHYGCSFEYKGTTDDGYERYICRYCGAERLYFESYGEKDENCNCQYTGISIYIVNGTEVFRREENYYTSKHNYKYEYVLDGESCEDGYTRVATCEDCDYRYEDHYSWHNSQTLLSFDLQKHGACYGSINVYACPCGENQYVNIYSCGTYTYNEYEENGYIVRVEGRSCKDCGLYITKSTYSILNSETCTLTTYYAITVSINGELILDEVCTVDKVKHDCEISGALLGGAGTSCEDGVRITYSCKNCDYTKTEDRNNHELLTSEEIDLSDFGSVCGGSATLYSCACGKYNDFDYDHSFCDFESEYCSLWFDGNLTGNIPVADSYWYYFGSDAYIYTCAVTDPTRCAFKIRYASYWLKDENECKAYRYEIWQLGYNSETGECLREIVFKTGEWRTHHDYVETDTENGTDYDCPDCGSYYYNRTYRDSESRVYKEQILAYNTLNDGNAKQYERTYEYGYYGENNTQYTKLYYEKRIYADGSESWNRTERTREDYQGTFGDGGYKEYVLSTSSSGAYEETNRAVVYYEGYSFDIYRYYSRNYSYGETDWYNYDYTYSFTDGCKRTLSYEDSYGEKRTETEDCHPSGSHQTITSSTCTQDGAYCYKCYLCEKEYGHWTSTPLDHSWVQVTSDWYYCSRCGLENANGASGSVIMEDLTDAYGNGENYVVGYYSKTGVRFTYFVTLVFANGDDVVLEGVKFEELTSPRAIAFSIADVKALAEQLGYTDSTAYDVKISFVPYGSDGSFDYAVTFADPTVDNVGVITNDVYFVDYLGTEANEYVITPAEDGEWKFEIFTTNYYYNYINVALYDEDGNSLCSRSGYGFEFNYELEAGKTYKLTVQSSYNNSYVPIRLTANVQ